MKSFWTSFAGAFLGMLVFVGAGMMVFHQDIFEVERDGVPKFRVTSDQGVTIGSTGSYENLVIETTGTNTVSITADAITVEYVRLASVSVTVNIGVLGAGGRDSALTEAANEWYYLFIITNNDGTSSNGLISESSTSPTLPSGYTKKRRVGTVRNDGSSNFLQFVQEGNKLLYLDANAFSAIASVTSSTYTTYSAAGFVPPTSQRGIFQFVMDATSTTLGTTLALKARKTGSGVSDAQARLQVRNWSTTDRSGATSTVDIDLNTSQQLDARLEIYTGSLVAGGDAPIRVAGYYDRF